MTDDALQAVWTTYQDAWAAIPNEERERLLRASVAEDVVFTSPNAEGQGMERLLEHIAEFQRHFPGAYFRSKPVVQQHGQMLSEWTMFARDGSATLTAHSYARFNEAGRLTWLAGFWKA